MQKEEKIEKVIEAKPYKGNYLLSQIGYLQKMRLRAQKYFTKFIQLW